MSVCDRDMNPRHEALSNRKVVPLLNKVPRHEDVWRIGGVAPHVLKLGARWR